MSELPVIHEWVKAARADDKAAWNILYQQYYPRLYSIALRICNEMPIAQDMVQDAFIIAYLNLPQLKDVTAFGAWIKKILIHTCYRALRRSQTNKYLDHLPRENESWWEDELNRKLDLLSMQSNLYTIVAHLPEALRSTILLRYFSAFQSYEEIAGILAIPIGTVRSRLNQAKLKLAEKWQLQVDSGLTIFKQGEEWNRFYHTTFSGMHHRDDCKNQFINHLQKDAPMMSPGGKPNNGRRTMEKMIDEDREFGSWLTPINVVSSGNISIIEAKHFNSPEYPHHCPPNSVMVIHRHKEKAGQIHLKAFPK